MDFPLFDFVVASLLMGLGIGADVAIATVARASHLNHWRAALIWIVGVSITHTLFPMVGYILTCFSIQVQPALEPVIGLVAFTCIFVYLRGELQELSEPSNDKDDRAILVTLGLILAVSWDALWSGPAKSAQVIGWPELLIWASFIVVGALVSLMALMSLTFALKIKQKTQEKETPNLVVLWLQYSVVAYFGLLAILRYTLGVNLYWWQILIASCVIIGAIMFRILGSKAQWAKA